MRATGMRRAAVAAIVIGCGLTAADAQMFKPMTIGASPQALRAMADVIKPPALPTAVVALLAQKAMNAPAAPPVTQKATVDLSNWKSGDVKLAIYGADIEIANSTGTPVAWLELDPKGSEWNISYMAGTAPYAVDCAVEPWKNTGALSSSYKVYRREGGSLKPLFDGVAPIANKHVLAAIPSVPAGTNVYVEFKSPKGLSDGQTLFGLYGCTVYQLG